jgi:hypothetical protein
LRRSQRIWRWQPYFMLLNLSSLTLFDSRVCRREECTHSSHYRIAELSSSRGSRGSKCLLLPLGGNALCRTLVTRHAISTLVRPRVSRADNSGIISDALGMAQAQFMVSSTTLCIRPGLDVCQVTQIRIAIIFSVGSIVEIEQKCCSECMGFKTA